MSTSEQDSQESQGEHRNGGDLRPAVDLNLPQQDGREDREDQVGNDTHSCLPV